MITWVLYLCIGIVIGGMAGFYFAKLDDFSKKRKQELEEKLHQAERELVEYKDQVTAHFIETANLINNMTESYQKVHEHLAHGSVELCNNAIEVNKLTVSTSQLLSSASEQTKDDDKVASLADSEAPKNSNTTNNKNEAVTGKPVDSETETESKKRKSATADSTGSESTSSSSDSETVDPAKETEQSPVLETMAVAEEEESGEQSETPVSGSRMVH